MRKFLLCLSSVALVLLVPVLSDSASTGLSAMPRPGVYSLYCASDDFFRHFCSLDVRGEVEIVRQRSEAACIYGRTWGYVGNAVWVDRGCRADFAVRVRREWIAGRDYRRGRFFYCASDDFNLQGCPADTSFGVRIVRQRSEAPCIYGRTWGSDERGVWVDRGCRADFEIGPGRYRQYGYDWDRDNRPY